MHLARLSVLNVRNISKIGVHIWNIKVSCMQLRNSFKRNNSCKSGRIVDSQLHNNIVSCFIWKIAQRLQIQEYSAVCVFEYSASNINVVNLADSLQTKGLINFRKLKHQIIVIIYNGSLCLEAESKDRGPCLVSKSAEMEVASRVNGSHAKHSWQENNRN